MQNPFEKPPLSKKHIETLNWIREKIEAKSLTFHDCLNKTEEAINKNDKEQALINCYYTANIIIGSNKTETEKLELLQGIKKSFDDKIKQYNK